MRYPSESWDHSQNMSGSTLKVIPVFAEGEVHPERCRRAGMTKFGQETTADFPRRDDE
jgi:hypothetical protein